MNPKDRERCDKDFLKCVALVAINLFKNKKDPYVLTENDIEPNGNKRRKTLRLLSKDGKIKYELEYYPYYRILKFNFKENFEKYAYGLASEPVFPNDLGDIFYSWDYNYNHIADTDINTIEHLGLKSLNKISNAGILYIWFHPEKFIIKKIIKENFYHRKEIYVYPRKKLKDRKILIMKGLFKKYAEPLFMPWLSKKFKVNLNELDNYTIDPQNHNSSNMSLTLELRNFQRYPAAFNKTAFYSAKGYKAEYDKKFKWLKEKTKALYSLYKQIEINGYEKTMQEFIAYAKHIMLFNAPLMLTDEKEKGAGQMILFNINILTFKNLFGDLYDTERKNSAT